jgi:hypothetical protein
MEIADGSVDNLTASAQAGRGKPIRLALDDIALDDRLQSRKIRPGIVKDYVGVLRRGTELPPVRVVRDAHDVYFLVDGFHRVAATRQMLGVDDIAVEIIHGTFEDALWLSWSANRSHGLRRTRKDTRRAIVAAVLHPSWSQQSDRAIAEHIGCDHKTVGVIRRKCAGGEFPTRRTAGGSPKGPSKKEILQACVLLAKIQPEQAVTFTWAELKTVREGYEPIHRLLFGQKTLKPGKGQVQEIVVKAA